MDADRPSATAVGVALTRAALERPSTPHGAPDADVALARALAGPGVGMFDRVQDPTEDPMRTPFARFIEERTRFFDGLVLEAIEEGTPRIVVLGAGYDGRALRFRHEGVDFVEVDHPATQADKRARLAELGIDASDVTFVAADFTEPGLLSALAGVGVGPGDPSLFLLEGVLRYLPVRSVHELFATVAAASPPGGCFALTIATARNDDTVERAVARRAHEDAVAEVGEPVHTMPDRDEALGWLDDAGWDVRSVVDLVDVIDGWHSGYLLVRATRRAAGRPAPTEADAGA